VATTLNADQHWAKVQDRIEELVAKINSKLPYSSIEIILLTILSLFVLRKILSVIN
jgi:hypothetical protein